MSDVTDIPEFDPSQPFKPVDVPAFDPTKPHEIVDGKDHSYGPAATMGIMGNAVVGGLKKLGNAIEPYTGVPKRAAEAELLKGNIKDAGAAYLKHFGDRPQNVPTDLDIAHQAGISDNPILDKESAKSLLGTLDSHNIKNSSIKSLVNFLSNTPRSEAGALLNAVIPDASALIAPAAKTIAATVTGVTDMAKGANAIQTVSHGISEALPVVSEMGADAARTASVITPKIESLVGSAAKTAVAATGAYIGHRVGGSMPGSELLGALAGMGLFNSADAVRTAVQSGKLAVPFVQALASTTGQLTTQGFMAAARAANSPDGKKIADEYLKSLDSKQLNARENRFLRGK